MVRKLLCVMVVMAISLGMAAAEEIRAVITKVEDGNVTFYKVKGEKGKGEKDGDAMTLPLSKTAKVSKGKYNKEDKKVEAGEEVEKGIKNEMFSKIDDKGVNARITTGADGKYISQILIFSRGKKKD